MFRYTLSAINRSTMFGCFCLFQTSPDLKNPNVMPVAWCVKAAHPTTTVSFTWTTDYCFVWTETQTLQPGMVCTAWQTWPADLAARNQITLTRQNDAFAFTEVSQGPHPGKLYIAQDVTIPVKAAAVGIGMAGGATHLVEAQPNTTLAFVPETSYWLAFGAFAPGQVLDPDAISGKQSITFDYGCNCVVATLNPDNTWSVHSTLR